MNRLSYLPPSLSEALAGYPTWLVIAVGVAAALVALWVLSKVIKWTLYLLLIVLAAGAAGLAIWMIWQALHGVPGPHLGQ